jgi:hypothetical protein
MVGGALGALAGKEGLTELSDRVQDARYLRSLAERVATFEVVEESPSAGAISKATTDKVVRTLKASKQGDRITLSDGREATINGAVSYRSRTGSVVVERWSLLTADEQSIYVKSLHRSTDRSRAVGRRSDNAPNGPASDTGSALSCRIKLLAQDLDESVKFYSDGVGLAVKRRTPNSVSISDVLLLVPKSYETEMIADSPELTELIRPRCTIVSVGAPALAPIKARLERLGVRFLTGMIRAKNYYCFRCIDPDGNIVEIFEVV